jgi:hypothetical protein
LADLDGDLLRSAVDLARHLLCFEGVIDALISLPKLSPDWGKRDVP